MLYAAQDVGCCLRGRDLGVVAEGLDGGERPWENNEARKENPCEKRG